MAAKWKNGERIKMNIPSVIRLIGVVFILSILPVSGHALTPGQVFDKVKDTVVVVKTLDAQGKLKSQGSGVLISSGRVATNCHVIEGGASYQVGRGKELVSATLYAEDGEKDICLLDTKGITGKPVELGKAAGLKVGDPVYALGAPQGLELSLSDGIVAQLRGGPPPLIQTTAAISPGSSGGGLFDGEGRLVGLTTLYLEGGQSLNFAMPVEWINEVKPGRQTAAEGHSRIEWLKRAMALEELNDWQRLLDWCRKWPRGQLEEVCWYLLGETYLKLNRYEDAIEAFRKALHPEFAEAWYDLGVAYSNLKRHDDAIEAYRQALRINPNIAEAWNNLGVAYGDLKRYNDAIDAFRQALRINPEFTSVWNNLGAAYGDLKRHDDAIDAYRQALRINPNIAEAWYNLGIAYSDLKRHDDAIEAYRQALRINPNYANAWYNLGIAFLLSGNRTAALDAVRELQHLDPARADKLFNLIVPR
ncbi:MAG: tetratricopeptide repeat protein [Deltaproteobacteria bacterium]|nr:tetratricopeptide repeat protein [Deltaproteobacteria bacterium]